MVALNFRQGEADDVADALARLDQVTRVADVTGPFGITFSSVWHSRQFECVSPELGLIHGHEVE